MILLFLTHTLLNKNPIKTRKSTTKKHTSFNHIQFSFHSPFAISIATFPWVKQIRQLSSYTCVRTDDILRGIKFCFGKSNTKHISILPGSLLTAQVCVFTKDYTVRILTSTQTPWKHGLPLGSFWKKAGGGGSGKHSEAFNALQQR